MGVGPRRRPARTGAGRHRPIATLRVIAIGRAPPGPERDLFDRYASRIRPTLSLTELADAIGTAGRRREGEALLASLPEGATMVALDMAGEALPSAALATRLQAWIEAARTVCFVIGGADGLDQAVLARAACTISLGPQTWPHLLARVMLAEQLYRARSISAGHPYHRAARPGGGA